jgi:Lar family restriction alleviation protein
MTTTMNTGAASLLPCPFCGCSSSPELKGNGIGDNWLECVECGASTRLREDGAGSVKDWNRRASTPQADAAPSLPRYTEWLHLRTHGQWSDGVPEWARDHDGRMNDVTAANAVIEELADAAIAAGGAQEPAQSWIDGVAAELWAIADVSGFDDFKLAVGGFLIATALPRVAATVALTDEQREAIEWAAGRAHVEALGKPIDGDEGKRWRLLSDMFRAAASNGEQA